ncbi:acyl CoA:acetate/3-ketoacid CoA transferase [Nonomuraea rhizosphaerae]|uniref:acyl CoA:acetate/3-ketoacid CoA transferase n=1 Tax=Nonomuraea rhizosphaerae TaxID=2665663 RepID=UPI001C5D57EC|nr:CoA-transferase [Nonomuraea rhizosphaerae]
MNGPKVVTAEQAVALVASGATVLVDGSGGGVNEPDLLLRALERRFLKTGQPRGLTLVHPAGIGDGRGGGMDRFAHEGMVRRVIGAHWAWSPRLQEMARQELIEAYCLPQGVMSHLLRAIAAGGPGLVSHVGLGTFVDPRLDGGRLNRSATEPLVELVELRGREWLLYHALPIDVAVIRASVADEQSNLVMDDEGLYAETLSAAQAVKNSGGVVLAQVKGIAERVDPRRVKVPGVLVDAVTVHPGQRLSMATESDPTLTGRQPAAAGGFAPLELTVRKVIARRAAQELRAGDIVNLGFGMPDGVAAVLAEEDAAGQVTLTLEQGHIGGVPATGSDFGLARDQVAMVDAGYQFDWYDGGGLDVAVLSFAEVDAAGDVNVSKFGGRTPGIGGFVNISQGARRVVFVGTFTAGKEQRLRLGQELVVERDGAARKFVGAVEQVSFSAAHARRRGRPVTYVTERAVFELAGDGLVLTEIAPGVDLDRDVIGRMAFTPRISPELRAMDARLFGPAPMGLRLAPAGAIA